MESSIADTTGTIYTAGGSSIRLTPAPAYINPPPFEEALKSSRSRALSASSTVDKPEFTGSEWSEQGSSKVALYKTMGTPGAWLCRTCSKRLVMYEYIVAICTCCSVGFRHTY